MRNYYRVMLGRKSVYAGTCFNDGFIGTDFGFTEDLTGKLPDEWRQFNKQFIPWFIHRNPGQSKISAGLACGALWTVSKGILKGDIVLCPDGSGRYRLGEVTGEYYHAPGEVLPHRRHVRWLDVYIDRADMSDALKNSTGSIGTVSDVSSYRDEIEGFLGMGSTAAGPAILSEDAVENLAAFAMEKHLEYFLEENWEHTELGKSYDIYEEDGERVGRQYQTDTGPLDILAISKDRKTLLVVELKKGRSSDQVVGQILRYMGYVNDELAESDQSVRGVIIALEEDQRIRRALTMTPGIEFFRYEISFKLVRI